MIYALARPLLFMLDAEKAHHLTLGMLESAHDLGLLPDPLSKPSNPVEAMGLCFRNPVGLAAGLDKNGEYIDALASLGFGSIEIGTVTPRAQPGNPLPRLFRLPESRAIINRMGFNNKGVENLILNVKKAQYKGILGINIGKNFDTPIEAAADDYLFCLEKVYSYASYVTINISSPNTRNLRRLQQAEALGDLLFALKSKQGELAARFRRHVPLAVKISPDLTDDEIDEIARLLLHHEIEAVIATNTTLAREGVTGQAHAEEAGGLSGAPLKDASTRVIRRLHLTLAGKIPIIGVGGIMSASDAREKMDAGASLIQIYSGLIYRGSGLVGEIIDSLSSIGKQ
ncbi:MAG: quinone-dependent dihydroorotate dehydrogenase [Burkholderiales bacterium]|nr:quinone-dependent dihydroorotate dehydrogenase [Burkholderiales bacterium]